MDCETYIDGEEVCGDDFESPISSLISHDVYLSEEYIFNFNTDLFKSYKRYTDSSD